MNKKWLVIATILAGSIGGGFATANLIEALKPYAPIITAGTGFIGAVVAFLVAKTNNKTTTPT